ncbi:MAG: hypothetical protein QM776_04510 [Rhodocyclaceae bacterium]
MNTRIVLFAIAVAIGGGIEIFKLQQRRDLALHAATVQATVTENSCANNGSITYVFHAGGYEYRNTESGTNKRYSPSCHTNLVGSRLPVTYSTKNPYLAYSGTLEDAKRSIGPSDAVILYGLIFLPSLHSVTPRKNAMSPVGWAR